MFGRQRKGGVLEVDLPNAKVIWRLRWDEFNLCDEEDYMYERFTVYGLDCSLVFRPMFYFHLDVAGEFEVHAVINGEEFTLTQNKRQVSPNRVPAGKDVEIVIHFVRLAPNSLTDALPKLLLKSHLQKTKALRAAEGEAKRLDGELQESEAETKRLAAEVGRCHALINAGSHQAAERECRLTGSAVKIEAKWRQVLTRRRFLRERDETDRRLRQAKRVRAILCLQTLWRLKQKKCQRRWLHAQNGCSNTETPYDAILAFDSLAEFLKEGKIEFLQKAEPLLEIAKESRYRVVAVVGLFDKGKTWLLNKLFGANLPAGKLCTTKGLSFLWIKERRMLVLDSAGVQSTVSYRAQAVDAIHDAQTTESLMFEMVSRISHRMVFVVNDLTWFEQKYVAMLHQKYVQCKQHKELIVVHNLRNTCDVAEASMLFRRQVMQCYDGEPSHQAKLIFTADLGEGVPPVHHIGLCYEFSKAGDAFNATNREYLLQSKGQRRKSGEPYIVHPVAVAELLALLKVQVDVIISGLLHDTVEDNDDIRFEDLESIFGLDVRRIVEGETKASKRTALGGRGNWSRRYTSLFNKFLGNGENKDSSPPKEMGKAQEQAENLRDMFLAMADDYRVILVKLADRLHNMRTLQYMPEIKQKTIAAETLVVFSQLAHRLGVWLFKTELEDLSFQYLYPTEFRTLNQLLSMRHAQHQSTLQAATHDFSNLLRHDPIFIEQNVRIEITGRAKGMYSLWEKMRRKPKYHNNIDNIDDIIALRIVLDIDQLDGESDDDYASRGAKLCNHALALARKLPKWSGGEGLKNYIAFPKPNGYQSLHVTFIHDDAPVPLEIQIRTRQMHEVAEYGMAAHWIYKSGQRGKPQKAKKQSRRVAWLESLADKDWELRADPQAFVQEVLRDELGKRCFVFLRDGTILNLSRGCTALDAAFKIHSEVGMHMLYPEINDKQVPPFYELQNGDRVNIVTAEDAVPQREWLACAFLRSTRNRLSARFRKQSKEKDRAVDLAAALATAATAAAALPLVH